MESWWWRRCVCRQCELPVWWELIIQACHVESSWWRRSVWVTCMVRGSRQVCVVRRYCDESGMTLIPQSVNCMVRSIQTCVVIVVLCLGVRCSSVPKCAVSDYLSICVSVNLSTWVSECLSVWVPEYLSIWISEYLSTWVSENLSTWVSEYLSTWVSEYLST